MFQINSDPQDKFQPVSFKDWLKGQINDVDPYDAPPDSLIFCKNLRYVPGMLENTLVSGSETIATIPSQYGIRTIHFNQSSVDDVGAENVTNFYYFQTYQSGTHNGVERAWNDGGWADETMGAFTNVFTPATFDSYGNIVDVGGSHDENSMNIQYINRKRYNDNVTLNDWYTTQNDTQAPQVVSQAVDSGADTTEALDISETDVDYYAASGHGLIVGDFIKIEDEIMRITADSGSTFTVVRAQKGTTAATHVTSLDIYAEPESDYLIDEPLKVACQISTPIYAENNYQSGDEVEYAISFVRDGNQESALTECGITCTRGGSSPDNSLELKVTDGDNLDKRVTAIRVYHKLNGGEWYFLKDIDMNSGQNDTSYYWNDYYNCYRLSVLDTGSHDGFTFTYHQKSGYPIDNESTNLRYKASHTYGNRRIVGNVYKNGKTYPGRLYISVPDQVNTFPDDNYLDLLEDDETAFTALIVWSRVLLAFKEHEMYLVDIRSPNEAAWKILDKRMYGIKGQGQVCISKDGVYFATERGIIKYDGAFKNITDFKIFTNESAWEDSILGFDFTKDELVVCYSSSQTYIYDRLGRWYEEIFWLDSGAINLANNENKELYYMTANFGDAGKTVRGSTSVEATTEMKTPYFRPGDDNDWIVRKVRLRMNNPESGTVVIASSIDGGAYTTLASGSGTARSTNEDILEWTGKKRLKTISFRVSNSVSFPLQIKEIIMWIAPRKGRKNA